MIEELLNFSKQVAKAKEECNELGVSVDGLAFYDELTKPAFFKDFYENNELIAITKELTDSLKKNKTIDW